MKKLAIIVDTFPRWSERFIARELQELQRRRVDFTVFCLKAGETLPEDDDWRGLLERRVVLPSSLLLKRPKDLTPATREHWDAARRTLGLRAFRSLGRAVALRDRLREDGFGHVHAHFASLPSTLGWLAALETGLPFSFSAHARDLFLEAQLLSQKLAGCVRVFTCHARAKAFLSAQTAQKEKVVLMRHGLPLGQYARRLEMGEPGLGFVAAGRFVPKKGFDVLLDAAALLRRTHDEFSLLLVGDGPERANLEDRIRRLGLEDLAVIEKPVGSGAMRDILSGADLLVAPFVAAADGDLDGVPNVILEAFALGAPVMGTDAGGLSEVLTPQTGTVVPQHDAGALATALAAFLDSPRAALKKTSTARELVEWEYDIHKNIEPLCELLRG